MTSQPTARGASRIERLLQLYHLRDCVARAIAEAESDGRTSRRLARRRPAMCGTDSGYYHHRRQLNERACDACRLAHNAAERDRARRRDAAA